MISLFYIYFRGTILGSESSLVNKKIKPKEVISIQFISAAGNPEYPVDSKVITSQEEIRAFIQVINGAKIDNVSDGELADCGSSILIINLKNKGTINLRFNGNNTTIVNLGDDWYKIVYEDVDLNELYENSEAKTIQFYVQ